MLQDSPSEDDLVRDLLLGENLPGSPAKVELRRTHASLVFLTPAEVFKIKRAKHYGFFDYSTLERRRHFTSEEVRLNRRAASSVYIGTLPVFRDAQGISLVREAGIVDWAVRMRRLPEEQNLAGLLGRRALDHDHLDAVARFTAEFHRKADRALPGEFDSIARNIRENFEETTPFVGRFLKERIFAQTRDAQERWLAEKAAILKARPRVDGHGDLRLDHVYLLSEGVVLIDCIEFLDRFRIADPALDAAFLAMELLQEGRPDFAEHFLARYAFESDDYDLYALIDGYMSYRAWVRAKVSSLLAADSAAEPPLAQKKAREAAFLFDVAAQCLASPGTGSRTTQRRLIAVGGLIGSGKSSLARALGRSLSVPVLGSDVTRKRLARLPLEAEGPAAIYTTEFTARVQLEMVRRARVVLESGRSVILDSTFAAREFRTRVRELSESLGARFLFVECRAPEPLLRQRLRERTRSTSDAREGLLDSFLKNWGPAEEIPSDARIVLDTSRPPKETVEAVLRRM